MIGEKLSEIHSDSIPQSELNPTSVSQPLAAIVELLSSPPSKVKLAGERINPASPPRPPSLLMLLGPVSQGDSLETSVLDNSASSSSWLTGGMIRKLSLPTRPPPLVLHRDPERVVRKTRMIDSNTGAKSTETRKLRRSSPLRVLIPTGRANREVLLQGDSSETAAAPVQRPASRSSKATGERIRKPSLPTRPGPTPPLVLHSKRRAGRKASKKVDSNIVAAKSRIITLADEGSSNRDSLCSLLPNPWDSDAQPQHATFESPIFQRTFLFTASSRANALQTGLPRNPRETVHATWGEIARRYPEHRTGKYTSPMPGAGLTF